MNINTQTGISQMKKYNWPRNILKDAINDVFDIEKEQRYSEETGRKELIKSWAKISVI